MNGPLCVVFDIGKTNKKVLVFDQHYRVVREQQMPFDEITDDDGFRCDDLPRLTTWIRDTYAQLCRRYGPAVSAVNVSAYGASLVHLGADGEPVAPLYNYLRDLPRDLHTQFFAQYGPADDFCTITASPDLGLLNSGLQLYWLKYAKPDIAAQIQHSLHLPQYASYLLTGQPVSEITSVGCHTALWDFVRHDYHPWLIDQNLHSIRQTPLPSGTAFQIAGGVWAGIGIHDSSAALVPYLKACARAEGESATPFVLLSTGTWSVSMNPFNAEPLTPAELRQDCLCYLSCEGHPVKSSRLFAGNEHERQIRHLADYFHKDLAHFRQVRYDPALVQTLRQRFRSIVPAETHLTNLRESPFVERNLNEYETYEEAYHQFMLDLVAQQVASLALAIGQTAVQRLFVDGGFSRNDVFMHLLADAYPTMSVQASKLAQASALGAALAIHDYWNPTPFDKACIDLVPYPAQTVG